MIITVISNPTKKEVVMYYAGIDAHTKSSTICIVDRRGRKVSSSTVLTNGEGFRVDLEKWAKRGLTAAVESSGEPSQLVPARRLRGAYPVTDNREVSCQWSQR